MLFEKIGNIVIMTQPNINWTLTDGNINIPDKFRPKHDFRARIYSTGSKKDETVLIKNDGAFSGLSYSYISNPIVWTVM